MRLLRKSAVTWTCHLLVMAIALPFSVRISCSDPEVKLNESPASSLTVNKTALNQLVQQHHNERTVRKMRDQSEIMREVEAFSVEITQLLVQECLVQAQKGQTKAYVVISPLDEHLSHVHYMERRDLIRILQSQSEKDLPDLTVEILMGAKEDENALIIRTSWA
eukprot:scaffold1170_cov158-Ochromonas_danica.AAC.19